MKAPLHRAVSAVPSAAGGITAALGLTAAGGITAAFGLGAAVGNAAALAPNDSAAAVVAPASAAAASELRDPTRPPRPASSAPAAREAAPVLSAVLTFSGKRTAIFNGQLVHSGSVVGAYTIDSIFEDGVRYRRAQEIHELHLAHPASTVKKPAAEAPRAPIGVTQ